MLFLLTIAPTLGTTVPCLGLDANRNNIFVETADVQLVSTSEDTSIAVGQMAPDFTLLDLDGQPHRLAEYKGRPVLLTFFASW